MSLIRMATIFTILGTLSLGIAVINAQVTSELPHFKSGASVMMGVPVDFNILNQRVGAIYEVVESDDTHIVWKFTGTTSDWAFVLQDGRIAVASTVDFDFAAKDTLTKELNDIMDMLNAVNVGIVSAEARGNALDLALYYATEPEIYHRLKFDFDKNYDLTLVVPDCVVENARFVINGCDSGKCGAYGIGNGQYYYMDDQEIASCESGGCSGDCCDVSSPVEITDKTLPGMHKVSCKNIDNSHSLLIEALTSSMPSRNFVLYGPNYIPWINETGRSMTLDDMNSLLLGFAINTTI